MPIQFWKALKNADRGIEVLRCTAETPQWAAMSAAYLGFARLPFPYILQLRRGEKIQLEELTDLKTFWQIFLRRVYQVRTSDEVILDLGANIGLFSLYAARTAPQARIFSFEPFPSTFRRLSETIQNHNLGERVTCLNYAATGSDGIRIMPDVEVPSQRRALASTQSEKSGPQVLGKTLEAILDENQLARVDLLKIDIEGSEYEVLLSTSPAVLKRIRRIALEYHGDSAPYSKQQLFDHLTQAGFAALRDACDDLGYGVAELVLSS